jgi:hypothetical protein
MVVGLADQHLMFFLVVEEEELVLVKEEQMVHLQVAMVVMGLPLYIYIFKWFQLTHIHNIYILP